MNSELPKLFDRSFAVGYFFPALVFLLAVLSLFGFQFEIEGEGTAAGRNLLWVAGAGALVSWIIAIGLAAFNHPLIRFLEGYYWPLSRFEWLRSRKVEQWRKLNEDIYKLDQEWIAQQKAGNDVPRALVNKRNKLKKHAALRFPDRDDLILPTGLGNVIRAFEVYPRIMYGLDGVPGWIRLLAVVPKDHLEVVKDSKARFNFCVNLFLLGVFIIFLAFYKMLFDAGSIPIFYIVISAMLSIAAYYAAKSAAVQWGALVKACFDTHLPKLAESLGYELPKDVKEQRRFWQKFSQSVIYHQPFVYVPAPELKPNSEESGESQPPRIRVQALG